MGDCWSRQCTLSPTPELLQARPLGSLAELSVDGVCVAAVLVSGHTAELLLRRMLSRCCYMRCLLVVDLLCAYLGTLALAVRSGPRTRGSKLTRLPSTLITGQQVTPPGTDERIRGGLKFVWELAKGE